MAKKKTCPACPACPLEVRDLLATLHNFIGAYERGDEICRVARKYAQMKESYGRLQAIADAHFRDCAKGG